MDKLYTGFFLVDAWDSICLPRYETREAAERAQKSFPRCRVVHLTEASATPADAEEAMFQAGWHAACGGASYADALEAAKAALPAPPPEAVKAPAQVEAGQAALAWMRAQAKAIDPEVTDDWGPLYLSRVISAKLAEAAPHQAEAVKAPAALHENNLADEIFKAHSKPDLSTPNHYDPVSEMYRYAKDREKRVAWLEAQVSKYQDAFARPQEGAK